MREEIVACFEAYVEPIKHWQYGIILEFVNNEKGPLSDVTIDHDNNFHYVINEAYYHDCKPKDFFGYTFLKMVFYAFYMENDVLIVRHMKLDDLDDYTEIVCQKDVREQEGLRVLSTRDEAYKELTHVVNDVFNFGIILKSENKLIGHICAYPTVSRADSTLNIGFGISKEYQKNGYCFEAASMLISHAFECTPVHMFEASYFEGNEASKATIKKLGFTYEGYMRNAYNDQNNGPTSIHVNSLMKEEWISK